MRRIVEAIAEVVLHVEDLDRQFRVRVALLDDHKAVGIAPHGERVLTRLVDKRIGLPVGVGVAADRVGQGPPGQPPGPHHQPAAAADHEFVGFVGVFGGKLRVDQPGLVERCQPPQRLFGLRLDRPVVDLPGLVSVEDFWECAVGVEDRIKPMQVAGHTDRVECTGQPVGVGCTVAVRVLLHKRPSDRFDVVDRLRPLQSQLVQPVLTNPGDDRRICLRLYIGDPQNLAVDRGRCQRHAAGLFPVGQQIGGSILLDVRGQVFERAGLSQLLQLQRVDDHHVGNIAAGNREVELIAVAVAGHYPTKAYVDIERLFDVAQRPVLLDRLSFWHQTRIFLPTFDQHQAGRLWQGAVGVGLPPGLGRHHRLRGRCGRQRRWVCRRLGRCGQTGGQRQQGDKQYKQASHRMGPPGWIGYKTDLIRLPDTLQTTAVDARHQHRP